MKYFLIKKINHMFSKFCHNYIFLLWKSFLFKLILIYLKMYLKKPWVTLIVVDLKKNQLCNSSKITVCINLFLQYLDVDSTVYLKYRLCILVMCCVTVYFKHIAIYNAFEILQKTVECITKSLKMYTSLQCLLQTILKYFSNISAWHTNFIFFVVRDIIYRCIKDYYSSCIFDNFNCINPGCLFFHFSF